MVLIVICLSCKASVCGCVKRRIFTPSGDFPSLHTHTHTQTRWLITQARCHAAADPAAAATRLSAHRSHLHSTPLQKGRRISCASRGSCVPLYLTSCTSVVNRLFYTCSVLPLWFLLRFLRFWCASVFLCVLLVSSVILWFLLRYVSSSVLCSY